MPSRREIMTIAVLLVALLTIIGGVGGVVFPDRFVTIRRAYYATPGRFYAAGAVRLAMGLVLILTAATISRWPKTLRGLGAVMCLQALTATLLGLQHARAVMEWEAMQGTGLLRAGAMVALVSGGLIAFAVAKRPSEEQKDKGSLTRF